MYIINMFLTPQRKENHLPENCIGLISSHDCIDCMLNLHY